MKELEYLWVVVTYECKRGARKLTSGVATWVLHQNVVAEAEPI